MLISLIKATTNVESVSQNLMLESDAAAYNNLDSVL